MQLKGNVRLSAAHSSEAIERAIADLMRDLTWALGATPKRNEGGEADIRLAVDAGVGEAEQYRIDITESDVTIAGRDTLGLIYGIYRFSHELLGVDPMWFWKDQFPQRRDAIDLLPQAIASTPATFRYRGWFLNDEDLLSEWKTGGGARFLDYAYYSVVTHPSVIDNVCETLLRLGGNMIIPASFIDVLNEPEAELVRTCVRRGLYVTQHHIEPLGVSHYTFENYWRAKGEEIRFDYGLEPERVRETWRAYAEKWFEIAGEQVIWQLGLRGRGDVPVWTHVPSITRDKAGRFISQAIAEQWEIACEADTRAKPPATATLWMEGSELMNEGSLTFPEDIALIFADAGLSQTLQPDFYDTERKDGIRYGVYYHAAFWRRGPHLVQGTRPAKLQQQIGMVAEKGDTHYAILNVCNIREHVLGIEAFMQMVHQPEAYDPDSHLAQFAPEPLRPLYERFLQHALVDPSEGVIFQDGSVSRVILEQLGALKLGRPEHVRRICKDLLGFTKPEQMPQLVEEAARVTECILKAYEQVELSPAARPFFDANLKVQAQILLGHYQAVLGLDRALSGDPSGVADAAAAIERVLEQRQAAATGKWINWYRGDRKADLKGLASLARQLARRYT